MIRLPSSALSALFLSTLFLVPAISDAGASAPSPNVAVAPQYGTTHVYVSPEDFNRFTNSFVATFGGHKSLQRIVQVTPTPSQTMSQLIFTPVGTLSVFGFKSPIPYPFGIERNGYLVTDMDVAVASAKSQGADITASIFPDPIGRDAIVEWPGGVHMQLYWHTAAPQYDPLQTIPENRVYVSPERADKFVRAYSSFSHGTVISDDYRAPGIEIGRPNDTYRRIRIESKFGKVTVLVTDGHLPYPYGRELTGYEVNNLSDTLIKAKSAGVEVLVNPFVSDRRRSTIVRFPGGYIAEIHESGK